MQAGGGARDILIFSHGYEVFEVPQFHARSIPDWYALATNMIFLTRECRSVELVMMKIRKAEERGQANYGWLNTHYTFSFADYYDPENMGFRALRVINDDIVG